MENKPLSFLVLSNTLSRFPSDFMKNREHLYPLLNECLQMINKGPREYSGSVYVVNPLIVDWLATEEAKELLEQFFIETMRENRNKINEKNERVVFCLEANRW
jgi:1,4-alpha-glucan branching enzyme